MSGIIAALFASTSLSTVSVSDPYFKNVLLLLHADGTNGGQNNTFIDSSLNNFTITRNGNTTQGSFNPYGALWSNYFEYTGTNNSAYVTVPISGALQSAMASATQTREFWLYRTAEVSSSSYVAILRGIGGDTGTIQMRNNSLHLNNGATEIISVSVDPYVPKNTWVHVAMSQGGGSVKLYINGVERGSSNTTFSTAPGGPLQIGGANDMQSCGYLSNIRISNSQRYTTTFTPPTGNFIADANTAFLAAQSNRFLDTSSGNLTFTRYGTARVSNFAPFAPTSAYTAAQGASGYFDGTGDYLSVSASANQDFGSSAFTVEFWWYPTANTRQWFYHASTDYWFGIDYKSSGSVMGLWASSNGSSWNLINADPGGNGISTGTPAMNAWNHVAVGRSSGTWSMWLNGTRVLNLTGITSAIVSRSAQAKIIGGWAAGGQYIVNGYMSNFRVVIGADVYGVSNSTITVPTAPLTAITNTSLLCNFENAAIFDSAAKNDLETVGNAQIDTTVKKFGTGSLEFDGNGDYLQFPGSGLFALTSATPFTIEFWIYPTASAGVVFTEAYDGATVAMVVGLYPTVSATEPTGLKVGLGWYSLGWNLTYAANDLQLNTWQHVACVFTGSDTKIYYNGVDNTASSPAPKTSWGVSNDPGGNWFIGRRWDGGAGTWMTGFLDDLRITKGVARYTENFTPPTRAFSDN